MKFTTYDSKKQQITGKCSFCKREGTWKIKIYNYSIKSKALKRNENEGAIICFSDGGINVKDIEYYLKNGQGCGRYYKMGVPLLTLVCPDCYRSSKKSLLINQINEQVESALNDNQNQEITTLTSDHLRKGMKILKKNSKKKIYKGTPKK